MITAMIYLAGKYVRRRRRLQIFLTGITVTAIFLIFGPNIIGNDTSMKSSAKVMPGQKDIIIEERESSDKRASFMGVGDNLIHESVYKDAKKSDGSYDFKPMYSEVEDMIKKADIAYIDQETIIAGDDMGLSGYPDFNTPKDMIQNVKDLGFDIVNIANNHILDRGTKGVIRTTGYWKDSGLIFDGAFATEEESKEIPIIEKNGLKIAFLCYTYGTNGLVPDTDWRVRYFDEEKIKRDIEKAKEMSDFILVSAHWGDENFIGKTDYQKHYANLFSDLGVDVVLGTHPHVIGPVEEMLNDKGEKTLVIYSTGNYLSAMGKRDNMLGYTATFDFVKDGKDKSIENIKMIPTITYFEKGSQGKWENFKIYKLEDYTDEMASTHMIRYYDKKEMSPDYFEKLFKETVKSEYR